MKTVELDKYQWSMIVHALARHSYQLEKEDAIDESRDYQKIFHTLHQKVMEWRTEEASEK